MYVTICSGFGEAAVEMASVKVDATFSFGRHTNWLVGELVDCWIWFLGTHMSVSLSLRCFGFACADCLLEEITFLDEVVDALSLGIQICVFPW